MTHLTFLGEASAASQGRPRRNDPQRPAATSGDAPSGQKGHWRRRRETRARIHRITQNHTNPQESSETRSAPQRTEPKAPLWTIILDESGLDDT